MAQPIVQNLCREVIHHLICALDVRDNGELLKRERLRGGSELLQGRGNRLDVEISIMHFHNNLSDHCLILVGD